MEIDQWTREREKGRRDREQGNELEGWRKESWRRGG